MIIKNNRNKLFHIAIIMDGNRRWARNMKKEDSYCYNKGADVAFEIINFSIEHKLRELTLYVFSKENWNRSDKYVKYFMNFFEIVINKVSNQLIKKNIRFQVLGNHEKFNLILKKKIVFLQLKTKKNTGLRLNLAINYSGRWDLTCAVKKILNFILKKNINKIEIKELMIKKFLSTSNCFPIDLVIRTGGEIRISNFCLWEIAYSELYFTDILWPEFTVADFKKAIITFSNRKRKFGC